jgi:hypothetical protein
MGMDGSPSKLSEVEKSPSGTRGKHRYFRNAHNNLFAVYTCTHTQICTVQWRDGMCFLESFSASLPAMFGSQSSGQTMRHFQLEAGSHKKPCVCLAEICDIGIRTVDEIRIHMPWGKQLPPFGENVMAPPSAYLRSSEPMSQMTHKYSTVYCTATGRNCV